MWSRAKRFVIPIGALLAVACIPFLTGEQAFIQQCSVAAAYVVMALGLNIIVGFAGLLDLGFVAFFAIGAFCVGWFASGHFALVNDGQGVHVLVGGTAAKLPGFHLNFLVVLAIAIVCTTIAGVVIGLPTLRLRGDYIAVVTLAFGEIISILAVNLESVEIGETPITAGRRGISPIDRIDLPLFEPFTVMEQGPWLWSALVLVVVALVITLRLRDSRLGRAWMALRDDEVAAVAMGVPAVKTKLLAYGIGASFGGVSGAFQASLLNTVNSDQFLFWVSGFVLAMVILGGVGSIWGVVVGAVVLSAINTWLIPDVINPLPVRLGLSYEPAEISFAIYGFLLVIMMILRPQGLIPDKRHGP